MGKRENLGLNKKNKRGNSITSPNNKPGVCIWQLRVGQKISFPSLATTKPLVFHFYPPLAIIPPWACIQQVRVSVLLLEGDSVLEIWAQKFEDTTGNNSFCDEL